VEAHLDPLPNWQGIWAQDLDLHGASEVTAPEVASPGDQPPAPAHSPGILLAHEDDQGSSIAGLGVSILAAMEAGTKDASDGLRTNPPTAQEVPAAAEEPHSAPQLPEEVQGIIRFFLQKGA